MANISGAIKTVPTSSNLVGGFSRVETFIWEPLVSTGGSTTETVATHNLVAIPAGDALVFAVGIVETTFAGATGTYTFQIGSDTLTGAIPVANLAAGDVIMIGFDANDDTTSAAKYAITADTLDVAIGTAAATAGRMYIQCYFQDVAAMIAQVNG